MERGPLDHRGLPPRNGYTVTQFWRSGVTQMAGRVIESHRVACDPGREWKSKTTTSIRPFFRTSLEAILQSSRSLGVCLSSQSDSLGSIAGTELGQDRRHMMFHRSHRQDEAVCDLDVGETLV